MHPAPAALTIAPGFTMPADAVTQTIGIIAKRNAGKTHTGVVLTEEMLDVGAQVVVLDPLGVWWGLRSTIDGKGKGYAAVVFGGDHGDLPLTEEMGAQIANAIVDHRLSAVLDLSALTKSATRRFAAAFFEQLYQAKGAEAGRPLLRITGKHPPSDFLVAWGKTRGPSGDDLLRAEWASLWSTINGRASYDANPMVWVIGFRRVKP